MRSEQAHRGKEELRPQDTGPATSGVFGGSAWRIGRISGIEIAIDHTWILIFLLVTLSLGTRLAQSREEWSAIIVWGTAGITSALFFASIVLHELGHSLVAQRLGVRVRSITLFVFGGLARLDSEPERPRDEALIAVAGPLVSFALGAIGLLGAAAMPEGVALAEISGEALGWLGRINLTLAVFNLVPGFPLDGGRMLRAAVWAYNGSFERATAIAAASGSVFAYTLIGFGIVLLLFARQLVGGLWLVFIGWFLLSAARATVTQVVLERMLSHLLVTDVMDPVSEARVTGSESVTDLVSDAVLRRGLRTFYVVGEQGALRGILTLKEIATIPAEERPRRRIEEIMIPTDRLAVLAPGEDGWSAFRRMAERNVNQLPVLANGRLLGAVTRERLLLVVQARLSLGDGEVSLGGAAPARRGGAR